MTDNGTATPKKKTMANFRHRGDKTLSSHEKCTYIICMICATRDARERLHVRLLAAAAAAAADGWPRNQVTRPELTELNPSSECRSEQQRTLVREFRVIFSARRMYIGFRDRLPFVRQPRRSELPLCEERGGLYKDSEKEVEFFY